MYSLDFRLALRALLFVSVCDNERCKIVVVLYHLQPTSFILHAIGSLCTYTRTKNKKLLSAKTKTSSAQTCHMSCNIRSHIISDEKEYMKRCAPTSLKRGALTCCSSRIRFKIFHVYRAYTFRSHSQTKIPKRSNATFFYGDKSWKIHLFCMNIRLALRRFECNSPKN